MVVPSRLGVARVRKAWWIVWKLFRDWLGIHHPPKAEATGSNPVGRASNFNELGLHRPVLVGQLTKNSPKVGVLDRVAGSRSAGPADGAAIRKSSNRASLKSKKSFCRPAPSLGREDFHSSVSRRGRRTAGGAPELITKCCGSERLPLLRRSGASILRAYRIITTSPIPKPDTNQRRFGGRPLSVCVFVSPAVASFLPPQSSPIRKESATERAYGQRVGCATTGPSREKRAHDIRLARFSGRCRREQVNPERNGEYGSWGKAAVRLTIIGRRASERLIP